MPAAPVIDSPSKASSGFVNRRPIFRPAPGHIVMVVAAGLAFLLTFAAVRDSDRTVEVARLGRALERGAPLQAAAIDFFDMSVGDETLPPGLITPGRARELAATGARLAHSVPVGSLLRESDFAVGGANQSRTMAFPVDRAHAVNGDLAAGDLVDLISVHQGVAGYVLTGAPVVKIGDGASGSARTITVTLELDAVSSLKLAHALSTGTLEVVKSTWAPPADPGLVVPLPEVADPEPSP